MKIAWICRRPMNTRCASPADGSNFERVGFDMSSRRLVDERRHSVQREILRPSTFLPVSARFLSPVSSHPSIVCTALATYGLPPAVM
jgi:hypothetical protein